MNGKEERNIEERRACQARPTKPYFFKLRLLKNKRMFSKRELMLEGFQNIFLCIYSGLKYRFCESFIKISPKEFVLALCPTRRYHVHTDEHYFEPLFRGSWDLKRIFLSRSLYVFYTITTLSLYELHGREN